MSPLAHITLFLLGLLSLAAAQDSSFGSASYSGSASASGSSSGSASVTPSPNVTQHIITTTLTTLFATGTASPALTAIPLTLTVNSTSYSNGTTFNTTLNFNETLVNATASNGTIAWNDTMDYLPFSIVIDGAYGTLGGLLILSGIPVAVLGGKNRWSSLAVASGYSLMLITLVLILRFGVEPNIQPPSPSPPSATLRGLYLLACVITAIIGSAIGIFLFKFAKYWVSAAGGFAFGWFLLACKSGGLITGVLGRWGLLGGLTVGAFVASLPEAVNPWTMLAGTAWIGATAFTLGVDCFTRGGLKEFYIYNLGFWDLFPSLNGGKYPLTQTMSIELGILGAMVIIGGAIQFRVLNILQKKLKQIQEEEEARIEADEVSKAAERFKNAGVDLAEWEEKHGSGAAAGAGCSPTDRQSAILPNLDFHDRRSSSRLSLLGEQERGAAYASVPLQSPTYPSQGVTDSPTDTEFLRDDAAQAFPAPPSPALTDPELEGKLRLLDEVKKAREEVRSSLDKLTTPTSAHFSGRITPPPSLDARSRRISTASSQLLLAPDTTRSRPNSMSGSLNPHLEDASARRISTASSAMLDPPREKRVSIASSRFLDYSPTVGGAPDPGPTVVETPKSEWEAYKAARNITQAPAPGLRTSASVQTPHARLSQYGVLDRLSSSPSSTENPSPPQAHPETTRRMSDFGPSLPLPASTTTASLPLRQVTGSARPSGPTTSSAAAAAGGQLEAARPKIPRTMTYEELSDRHRKRLSALQMPVTSKMQEEVDLANAKKNWERQQKAERDEMRRREARASARAAATAEEQASGTGAGRKDGGGPGERRERMKSTDEWRRSMHGGLDQLAGTGGEKGKGNQNQQRMSRQLQ